MSRRVDPWALWVRSLLVGAVAFLLGVAGHVMADGLLPGLPVLVALFVLGTLTGVPVLARRASSVRLALVLVTGQTAIHLGLSLTAGHAGQPSPLATAGRDGVRRGVDMLPVVDGHRVGSLQDAYTRSSSQHLPTPTLPVGHLIDDLSAHAPMMLAHLVVAALVGLWLALGERRLWHLVDLLGQRLVVVLVLPAVTPTDATPHPRVVAHLEPTGPRAAWLARPGCRRGPPFDLTA